MTGPEKDKIEEFVDWLNVMNYWYNEPKERWEKKTNTGTKIITIDAKDGTILFYDKFTGLNLLFSNVDQATRVLAARKTAEITH